MTDLKITTKKNFNVNPIKKFPVTEHHSPLVERSQIKGKKMNDDEMIELTLDCTNTKRLFTKYL